MRFVSRGEIYGRNLILISAQVYCLLPNSIGTDSAVVKVLFVHVDKLTFRGSRCQRLCTIALSAK